MLPDDFPTQGEVLNALSDADPAVQVEACRVIGRFEERAKDAVPQLEKMAQRKEMVVRQAAYTALVRIGSHNLSALPFLLAGIERSDAVAAGHLFGLLDVTKESANSQLITAYQNGSVLTKKRLLTTLVTNYKHSAELAKLGLAEADVELRLFTLQRLTRTRPFDEIAELVRPFLRSTIRSERLAAAQQLAKVKDDTDAAAASPMWWRLTLEEYRCPYCMVRRDGSEARPMDDATDCRRPGGGR